jgi:hypothetical protein
METRGRKPGYKHSESTKQKIRDSLLGRPHSKEHKDNLAVSRASYDLDGKCERRFEELRSEYPEEPLFFEDNRQELIFAMQTIRSESELDYIRKYVETGNLNLNQSYLYETSSFHAAEDAMIALLDFKRYLQKLH